jgi:hypothetical protein
MDRSLEAGTGQLESQSGFELGRLGKPIQQTKYESETVETYKSCNSHQKSQAF